MFVCGLMISGGTMQSWHAIVLVSMASHDDLPLYIMILCTQCMAGIQFNM